MDDKLKTISGMLCDILRLANGQISGTSADKYLINQMELIDDLSNHKYKPVSNLKLIVSDIRWKQCDYILHAIFWTLHDKVPFKVMQGISDEKILLLRDMIDVAKNRAPLTDADIEFAHNLCDKYKRENILLSNDESSKKAQNNIIRFSASLTITVAKNWEKIIIEIEKWSDYINERIKVSGLENTERKRPANLPLNPRKNEFLPPVTTLETSNTPQQKHADKKATKEKTMETKSIAGQEPISESDKFWTTETLAQKLGLKSKACFAMKKMKFLKKHPEHHDTIQGWFTNNGARFKAEHFEELKQLFAKYAKRAKTVATPTPVADTPIEQPTDLVGIKALTAYLEKIKQLCEQTTKEQQKYKDLYADLQKQADTAKENENATAKRVNELQENISAAETLLTEYNDAKSGLIAAEKLMAEKRKELDEFLLKNQSLQK